jgi:hypothetical protein
MEQKNNSGALFRASKEKETQPDYTGSCLFDGKPYKMSGWVNKSKAGKTYLRILFTEDKSQDFNPTASQATMPMQPQNSQQNIDSVILDDLPF